METISIKQRFLEDNTYYKEVKPSQELTTIGRFQDIDDVEDEVWLLQCPKGFDIESELQGQKLKIPGRTNINLAESIAIENAEPETRAFGYCNRKGRYSLRLLPVKGNILLRGRLRATEAVTLENAEALCPPQERVPLPEMIKVRHPLHGHQFDKSLLVESAIAERLRKADELSAKVHYEAVINRKKFKNVNVGFGKEKNKSKPQATADEDVESIGEVKLKHRKKNRKLSESSAFDQDVEVQIKDEFTPKKKKKSHKSDVNEEVAKDLQWLQNI